MVESFPISSRDQSWLHQFGKKVLPGVFLRCALFAGEVNLERRHLVSDMEELEYFDASEIHARRLIAKEVATPKNVEVFILQIADGTAQLFGRDCGVRKFTFSAGPTCEK